MDTEFREWLKNRPRIVQELAQKYPPGEYLVKEGAPYGVSTPGTKVTLFSYLESGEVGVVVKAEDKKPEALAHEEYLCQKFNKTKEETEEIHMQNILVTIDPVWLLAIN